MIMEPQEISSALNNIKIVATNSCQELANNICQVMHKKLTPSTVKYHANTEIKTQISDSIRGFPVYIISTGAFYQDRSVNDHLMEILCMADACKRSDAKSICLIAPFFPYSRSDKKDDGRCAIGAALVSRLLGKAGITRMISIDLHAGQIQGFTKLPFDNLYAINIFCDYLLKMGMNDTGKYILISPDNGGAKRVDYYAKKLKMPFAIMNKQRDYSTESKVESSQLLSNTNYKGKTAIVIDDIIDTCGTMISACNELKVHGIKDAIILATHGVLSKDAVKRINECEFISQVIITNSLPHDKLEKNSKFKVLDISQLLAEVIVRLETNCSISKMFE
jgi:ribose-phosphate pyrophosphokinase